MMYKEPARLIDATPIEMELFKIADKPLTNNPYENIKINAYRKCFEKIHYAPTIETITRSCKGCINFGAYENEVEAGVNSPCTNCTRRAPDNYTRR